MIVNEIFNSINGEVNFLGQGSFATFIRLAGCNFKEHPCLYCDTPQALPAGAGQLMPVKQIVKQVEFLGCKNITITGGEPLLQKDELAHLCDILIRNNYKISIETNGSIAPDYSDFDFNQYDFSWVFDYKLGSSGNTDYMLPVSFFVDDLMESDFVKFVIGTRIDYEEAKEISKDIIANVAFSPVVPNLSFSTLMKWMQEDKLFDYILNVQLHKLTGVK